MSSSLLAWTCSRCTYEHKCHATRCVMCDQPRVTKEHMRDFINGKTLPKSSDKRASAPNVTKENQPPSTKPPAPPSVAAIQNPYARKMANTGPAAASVYKPPPSSTGIVQTSLFQRPSSGGASVARPPQQSAATLSRPSASSTSGNNPFPQKRPASAIGQGGAGTANQNFLPMKRPASNAMSGLTGGNINVGNLKPPPKPNANTKNPFTMAVRPPPIQYTPGPVPLSNETATDWIYPVHQEYPIRDYQLEISQTSVLCNTLVSLPTGLGKTLIASVVLYNFYRWFPTGKVIFLAPTLPLVNQQVKACYDIMGIPAEDTALLTGKVNGKQRAELWKERRVFFCTPQTVQRDIEGDRCPSSQVVCVVLDEAHKASGAYAYVKVVQYLEEAGAKFRILGLSATPGTGIKAIQEVVTSLRIQKIEARLEDDPNIKKYVHERQHEIVLVKSVSVVNTIERLLDDVISPLIERIRAGNGLNIIRGNATLTSWCVQRAMQEYHRRTNDSSLDPYFWALMSLVGIRAETRRTGIGVVRTKMLQLRNQPKGFMCTVVRSQPFQTAMDAVLRASSDPNNVNERSEDRKLNNPKLMKLDEILTEHFERAKACGHSSRAIVFTQWRDSVSEIVSVLSSSQPLLKARHFVGQGKSSGGANKERIDQSCVSLKGMKQKEQQEVIKQFRDGQYNILVCTCIGEEGLDIGEVDLIVNYDSLRSPIRMIQRVGRTGRKRDGRVVCLVSEGAEERTMNASKNAEKTLGRALTKADAFKFVRGSPMFPQKPDLNKVVMSVTKEFHMSQVGGNGMTGKSKGSGADTGSFNTNWQLTGTQEAQRKAMLGDVSMSTCLELESSDGQLPQALRKRLLRARTRSISTYENHQKRVSSSFRATRKILLTLERKHGKETDRRVLVKSGRSRRESGTMNQLFPLERSTETDTLNQGLLKLSLSVVETDDAEVDCDLPTALAVAQRNGSPEKEDCALIPPPRQPPSLPPPPPPPRDHMSTSSVRPQNPYLSQTGRHVRPEASREVRNVNVVQPNHGKDNGENKTVAPAAKCVDTSKNTEPEPPVECETFHLPSHSSSSSDDGNSSDDDSVEAPATAAPGRTHSPQSEKALADSKHPAGDKSTDRPLNDEVAAAASDSDPIASTVPRAESTSSPPGNPMYKSVNAGSGVPTGVRGSVPTPSVPIQVENNVMGGAPLRLPTQDSSSDDESSDGSESNTEQPPSHAPPLKHIFRTPNEINVENFATESVPQEDRPSQMLVDTPEEAGDQMPSSSNRSTVPSNTNVAEAPVPAVGPPNAASNMELVDTLQVDATPRIATRFSSDSGAELVDTPQVDTTPRATPSSTSGADLVDTPQCNDEGRMLPPPSRTMSSRDSQSLPLDHAEEVVCAICHDGASPEDNPIVLCDGPNNDLSCPLAVHKFCYSITEPLDGLDHWHCDACASRQQQRQSKKPTGMHCFVCQKGEGPLKEQRDSVQSWYHPQCRHVVVDSEAFCQYCASMGSTRCSAEGCNEYAHPYCGLKLKEPWIVVAYASSEPSASANLNSGDTIGCNIYCPNHRSQVVRALVRVGVDVPSSRSKSPSYVIVSSKLRDNNTGVAPVVPAAQRKRLRKKSCVDSRESSPDGAASTKVTARETVESADQREQKRQRVRQRMKERTTGMQRCRFLDLEVDMDSEEDVDGDHGEEDEARRIEEEEAFYKDFINDSSQLTTATQDDLDRLGLSENAATQGLAVHRRVDALREKANQFATPIFNRRMLKHGRNAASRSSTSRDWDQPTPASAPSSQKGLGNMHFIRSVLEHHQNGGEADDIEKMYHTVAQDASPLKQDRPVSQTSRPGPIVMPCASSDESDSEEDDDGDKKMPAAPRPPVATTATATTSRPFAPPLSQREPQVLAAVAASTSTNPGGGLTAEQMAKIERNRQEALKRRQQHMAQQRAG